MSNGRVRLILAACTFHLLGAWGCAEGETIIGDSSQAELADEGDVEELDELPEVDCSEQSCVIGSAICGGNSSVVSCVPDMLGCGVLGVPVPCDAGQTCKDGVCGVHQSCIDKDGDRYGEHCALGPDCDDEDTGINPGVVDMCGDGVDNDCSGDADEGCAEQCAGQPCVPGQKRCATTTSVEECVADVLGCGVWNPAVPCGGACVEGLCAGCVDGDGDGRGEGCALGSDCDDGDPLRYSGATESCDNIDNDCDTLVDEDFDTLGQSCTSGVGACQRSGQLQCNSSGTGTRCSATAGSPGVEHCGDAIDSDCDGNPSNGFEAIGQPCQSGTGACAVSGQYVCDPLDSTQLSCQASGQPVGSREICDGVDNDCDTQVDEEGVCFACFDDEWEPQNTGSSTTISLDPGQSRSGVLCGTLGSTPADGDWFFLGTWSTSFSTIIELSQPWGANGVGQTWADVDVDFFCGSGWLTAMHAGAANDSITISGNYGGLCSNGARVTMRAYVLSSITQPSSGTPYTLTRR